ncbi:MAG: methionine--tRNA ligase [Candidatus Woesearchaeota archaeon]
MMRIITCALPYANGDLHLGHLLEYVMGDIHARVLRSRGEAVLFICADDAHGTPIEVAARKRGIRPEALVEEMRERHQSDFEDYAISFDEYHTTHSDENRTLAESFYASFKDAGLIEHRDVEQYYDEKEGRFLPDRFIRGTCPKCSAEDQNGDSCDACGAHYDALDLVEPRSILSGTTPVLKTSTHAFFTLSKLHDEARAFMREAELQDEIVNYIERWIEDGLADWDVSRDGPYFGFKIPGEERYFYVWLDAPIGYIATAQKWADRHGRNNPWNTSHITHIIGKDIIYFHFLFWPQMLRAAGYKQPDRIQVHGFLNVAGEKMSKSRGTFVLASELAERYDPNLVRFYLARKIRKTIADDDFTFEELEQRINTELVGNLLNLAYRTLTLISKRTELAVDEQTFDEGSEHLINRILEQRSRFEAHAADFDIARASDELLKAGDAINTYLQEREPWKEKDNTRTLATAWVAYQPILDMLESITPELARRLRSQFATERSTATDAHGLIAAHREMIGHAGPSILVRRIEPTIHPVESLDLRIARIIRARKHPNADALYLLDVDLGSDTRTIVSGLRGHYTLEALEGRLIVIVANLKPAVIRGEESQGMLLAGCTDNDEHVVLAEPIGSPGERVRAGGRSTSVPEATIKDVLRAGMRVQKGAVTTDIGTLRSLSGPVTCTIEDGALVR